ncbi:archease [Candidatus Acetothermia bacterium]|nr:archease [Candidatus Acetothermia bacterium]
MPNFEFIDHTADIGIIAYGNSVEEVFVNAAYGMFSLIADLEKVAELKSHEVIAEALEQDELLVTWLNELLYLFDAEGLIFSRFEIVNLRQQYLRAMAYGEKVDPSRHNLKTHIKAATYHQLKLETKNDFKARIILDL